MTDEPTPGNRRAVTRLIREWRADVVTSHRPNDCHPDHRYAGVLVQDAAYMVTVPGFCPDVPHLERNPVFLYYADRFLKPNQAEPVRRGRDRGDGRGGRGRAPGLGLPGVAVLLGRCERRAAPDARIAGRGGRRRDLAKRGVPAPTVPGGRRPRLRRSLAGQDLVAEAGVGQTPDLGVGRRGETIGQQQAGEQRV